MTSMQEKIFEAADALDAAGKKPTLSAVRKAIAGGSYTTISDTMQVWRARKAAKENRPVAHPPAAVTESLADLGSCIAAGRVDVKLHKRPYVFSLFYRIHLRLDNPFFDIMAKRLLRQDYE